MTHFLLGFAFSEGIVPLLTPTCFCARTNTMQ